jgi:hypothetical protein
VAFIQNMTSAVRFLIRDPPTGRIGLALPQAVVLRSGSDGAEQRSLAFSPDEAAGAFDRAAGAGGAVCVNL